MSKARTPPIISASTTSRAGTRCGWISRGHYVTTGGESMDQKLIGIVASGSESAGVLDSIEQADQMGIPAAWLTTGGVGLDALTLFAAAAVRTNRIRLGTSITPTFPRHPLVVVQQV